jgi:hypothetical protein
VGDHQRIPAVVCFFILVLASIFLASWAYDVPIAIAAWISAMKELVLIWTVTEGRGGFKMAAHGRVHREGRAQVGFGRAAAL